MRQALQIVMALMAGFPITAAQAQTRSTPEVLRIAVLTAMGEAASSNISLLRDRIAQDKGSDDLQGLGWGASYTDRDWTYQAGGQVNGKEIGVTITGYVWDEENNIRITYAGTGHIGDEPFRLNGQSIWPFNEKKSDYVTMNFKQVAKFGQHSFWGWVIGTEVIVGGTIGAAGAVASSAIATSGGALIAATLIGTAGAAAGTYACVGVSSSVKNILKSDGPVQPPSDPPPPPVPNKGEVLAPGEGRIYTAVTSERIVASSPDNRYLLSGQYFNKYGEAKGYIGIMKR